MECGGSGAVALESIPESTRAPLPRLVDADIHGAPAPALAREPREAPGEVAEDLLSRYRPAPLPCAESATEADLVRQSTAGRLLGGLRASEQVLRLARPDQAYFWATHTGAELDLLMFKYGQRVGVEFKSGRRARADPLHVASRCTTSGSTRSMSSIRATAGTRRRSGSKSCRWRSSSRARRCARTRRTGSRSLAREREGVGLRRVHRQAEGAGQALSRRVFPPRAKSRRPRGVTPLNSRAPPRAAAPRGG